MLRSTHSLIITFVITSMLLIALVVIAIGHFESKTAAINLQAELQNSLIEREAMIEDLVRDRANDTLFLAALPPINGIIRATAGDGMDARQNSSLTIWRERLQVIFRAYLENHSDVTQVRYIGITDEGRELVRVDRTDGQINIIPEDQLQTKGRREYFQLAIKQPTGGVSIAPITLNQEHGLIDTPHTPMLRTSTPIYDDNGNIFGIVIINTSLSTLFQSLQKNLNSQYIFYLLNDERQFLIHPDASKSFGFDLGSPYSWDSQFIEQNPYSSTLNTYFDKALDQTEVVLIQPLNINNGELPLQLAIAMPKRYIDNIVFGHQLKALPGVVAGFVILLIFFTIYLKNYRLRVERKEIKNIIDAAPIALIMANSDGVIELVSQGVLNLFGYTENELIGKPVELLMPDNLREHHPKHRQNFMKNPGRRDMSLRTNLQAVRKDGSRFFVEIGLNTLPTAHGVKLLAALNDISNRVAIEKKTDQLKAILEQTPDFIGTADISGNLLYHNAAAINMVGLSGANALDSMKIGDMHTETISKFILEEAIPTVLKTGVWQGESLLLHRDGYEIPVSQVILAHRNEKGEVEFLSTVMRDISEQKKRQKELSDAQALAETANRAKSNFIANMSHEIRTPLNAVLGIMQLIRRTELSIQQRDYIARSETAAQTLLQIINDILDFSKIEAGKMALEAHSFILDEWLRNIGNIMAANLGAKEIELLFDIDSDVPPVVIGDSLRLQQILINLTGNAIKFTEQGEVRVVVTTNGEELLFQVIDTGIGIASDKWSAIFDGFSQAEASTTRKYGGTGLGLAISKRLVDLMGGQLSGHSELGKGTLFEFSIPLLAGLLPTFNGTVADELKDLKVLVVDDNKSVCDVVVRLLKGIDSSWLVDRTISASSAMEMISMHFAKTSRFYDLVLADSYLMQTQQPGFPAFLRDKYQAEQVPYSDRPLLFMMCRKLLDRQVWDNNTTSSCIDAFVTKPITATYLLETLTEALQNKEVLASSAVTQQSTPLTLNGLHILLVEDNLFNQEIAIEALSELGAEITVAEHGKAAIDIIESNREQFGVVLMDIQMPELDGYSATRLIREQLQLDNLPIIAMTANAMAEDRDMALAAGMNDHVAKPIDWEALFQLLTRYRK
ncbi:PAS domain S-box protein [Halioxenophilus sp. WMMB6]|uniref:PAS domain S-box protein n=1 Tax=Halioxenophilus sp. WMMB6 TaxID=3073815 RepID=UPI00295E97D2|nr:PAS domain S-box protein [Halioxenophilus sp. WMMB6]